MRKWQTFNFDSVIFNAGDDVLKAREDMGIDISTALMNVGAIPRVYDFKGTLNVPVEYEVKIKMRVLD